VRVNPDQPNVLALAPVVFGHPAHRAGRKRVIAADGERSLALLQRVQHLLGQFGAGGRDLAQVACLRIAEVLLLGQRDADVARILDLVASASSLTWSPATRSADGPMSTPRRCWPRSSGTPMTRIRFLIMSGNDAGTLTITGSNH